MTTLRAGAATDVGRVRANNQDQLLVAEPLFAVADGMGGHAAGEVASQTALDALQAAFAGAGGLSDPGVAGAGALSDPGETGAGGPTTPGDQAPDGATPGVFATPLTLRQAVRVANRAVWDASEGNAELRGMGTTLTGVALVHGDAGEELVVFNVGDSRTYRLRDGALEQLTADHSLVAELVAEGRIRPEDAETHPQRHVLTRALGVYPDVDVDLLTFEPRVGDRYLICSDGLSREVSDPQVASVLRRLADPGEAARELVAHARAHGGNDNITVVIVDVVADGTVPEVAPPPGGEGPATSVIPIVDIERAAGPTATAPPPVKGPDRRARRQERRAAKAAKGPKARLVTARVIGFFVLALVIVGAAFAATAWYARESYFVRISGTHLTVFKGRPGGVLWWEPTVADLTGVGVSGVEAHNLPALRAGVVESSLGDARQYVRNLQAEKAAATPTTTLPPATTVPATTVPATTVPPTTTTPPTTVAHPKAHHHKAKKTKKAA